MKAEEKDKSKLPIAQAYFGTCPEAFDQATTLGGFCLILSIAQSF